MPGLVVLTELLALCYLARSARHVECVGPLWFVMLPVVILSLFLFPWIGIEVLTLALLFRHREPSGRLKLRATRALIVLMRGQVVLQLLVSCGDFFVTSLKHEKMSCLRQGRYLTEPQWRVPLDLSHMRVEHWSLEWLRL